MSIENNPTRVQVLETFAIFACCAVLASQYLHRPFLVWLAVLLLVFSLIATTASAAITRVWLRLSRAVAAFNSSIILALAFFLVLTPLAVLYRLFNKDALHRPPDGSGSFFVERNHVYEEADLRKMW